MEFNIIKCEKLVRLCKKTSLSIEFHINQCMLYHQTRTPVCLLKIVSMNIFVFFCYFLPNYTLFIFPLTFKLCRRFVTIVCNRYSLKPKICLQKKHGNCPCRKDTEILHNIIRVSFKSVKINY